MGVLTKGEFDQQKRGPTAMRDLKPAGPASVPTSFADVPASEKLWVQGLALIAFVPVGLWLILRNPSFQPAKGGRPKRVGKGVKAMFAALATLLWLINLAQFATHS